MENTFFLKKVLLEFLWSARNGVRVLTPTICVWAGWNLLAVKIPKKQLNIPKNIEL